ncbi:MAG: DNA-processing protein DprA [bacterium]|nr:DNA-processing protein DprA [bacterium]
MKNPENKISNKTHIALLLCASLNTAESDAKPLSPGEFGWILDFLNESGKSIVDLLENDGDDLVKKLNFRNITPERIRGLLDRGGLMAIALEELTNSGIWVLSRLDDAYPEKLLVKFKNTAPPILYGAGDAGLLSNGGLAIVGSRDVDEAGLEFTKEIASRCAGEDITVISGGARGVDQVSMQAASEYGGMVVGVLASDLAKSVTRRENRNGISDGKFTLVSPYNPNAGFNVGNAMGRNKYIYALSDWAMVVSSDFNKGGTWAGATENLKSETGTPLFVRIDDEVPEGNKKLVNMGGIIFTETELHSPESLRTIFDNMSSRAGKYNPETKSSGIPGQLSMFEG